MIVNDNKDARAVRLRLPGAGTRPMRREHFFSDDYPNNDGFPLVKECRALDPENGIARARPSRGVTCLTTLDLNARPR